MAQHSLHSKEARAFARITNKLTDAECEQLLARVRWGSADQQACPSCGTFRKHYRRARRRKWRCAECMHEFSVTSQTMLDSHKMSFRDIVIGAMIVAANTKGAARLLMSRLLGWTPKTAHVFTGKIREYLVHAMDMSPLEGIVHIDGAYFCGKPRSPRRKIKMPADAIAKRFGKKKIEDSKKPWVEAGMTRQNWERRANKRVVISLCASAGFGQGSDRTVAFVCKSENAHDIQLMVKRFVKPGTVIMTDESGAYGPLSAWYDHYVVQHSHEYSTPEGVNNNMSETFNSRMRRSEYGVFHGFRAKYLQDYACEFAWRESIRSHSQEKQVLTLLTGLMCSPKSRWWRGYWQGRHRDHELSLSYFL